MNNGKDWSGDYFSVCGTIGARNLAREDREQHDYYATHPDAARHLIELESLSDEIWEPACGAGHLSQVFQEYGFRVRSTDLIFRGYGEEVPLDFLKCSDHWHGDIVTNPPYKYALEFVNKALELVDDGRKVCMFLKLTFLEGSTRRDLFRDNPPARVWVSRKRLKCAKNGNFKQSQSMLAFCWFVWVKGYHGETVIKWFN